MAASETLSELLIRIRTVGEKEAKEALGRALKASQDEQKAFKQRLRDQQKAEDQRLKELTATRNKALKEEERAGKQRTALQKTQANDLRKEETKADRERIANQKAADRRALNEKKTADRERIAQEKATVRALEQARKASVANAQKNAASLAKDLEGRRSAGEGARSAFMSGGQKFGDRIVGGAVSLGKAAVVGAAGVAVGGAAAFDAFLEKTSELKTFAAFTAMTTERLQEMNFAVEQNGMSGAKFADGLRQFNAGMRESAKGGGKTGAVAEAIKDIGLSFKEIENLSSDEQVFTILKRLEELGPSFARGGVAAKLFGEIAGAEFARVADSGVENLRATAKSATDLGFVLESTVVDQGVRVKQQLDGTMAMIGGVKNSILAGLLPVAERYIGAVREWLLANKDLIKTSVVEWLGKVEQAAKAAWPDVRSLLKVAADLVPVLVSWGPVLLEIGVGLKALGAAQQAADAIKTLSGAFTTAQGSAAAFAGASGVGAIIQAFLILLPIALKVGDALGDIGSMESESRANLAQQLINSERDRRGNLKGSDAYLGEAAGLSDSDFAKLESEVIRGARDKGSTLSHRDFFNKARTVRSDKAKTQAERDAVKERVMSGKQKVNKQDLEWLQSQGYLNAEEAGLVQGRRNTGRLTKARAGEKENDKLSDAELMKLIDKAVKSGANLQDLIGQRKLAGTTPPVITITQHIYNVTANATMTIKGAQGQSDIGIAQVTIANLGDWLSTEIRKALPEGRVAR